MHVIPKYILATFILFGVFHLPSAFSAEEKIPFVIQLTRSGDDFGHRRAFLQMDKVLSDLGEDKLEIVVVAYEDGIHALLADNTETSQLLSKLANRGVTFRACRISMKAWKLDKM